MKITRILSVILVVALLVTCPGAAFAQSNVAEMGDWFWTSALDIMFNDLDFSLYWRYEGTAKEGVEQYSQYLLDESLDSNGEVFKNMVLFEDANGVSGADKVVILSPYDDPDSVRYADQISYLIGALLYISTWQSVEQTYDSTGRIVEEAMSCVTAILDGETKYNYWYSNYGVQMTIRDHSEVPGHHGIVITLYCDVGDDNPIGSAIFTQNYIDNLQF